jgi:hypothetical protein
MIGPFSVLVRTELEVLDVAAALLSPAAIATLLFPVFALDSDRPWTCGSTENVVAEARRRPPGPVAAIAPR